MSATAILRKISVIALMLAVTGGTALFSHGRGPDASLQDLLRLRIESAGAPLSISVGREPVRAVVALPEFYERRTYQPAWTDGGAIRPSAGKLLEAVRRADSEGLTPADYHLEKIHALLLEMGFAGRNRRNANPAQLVDLDLLLTDAFLVYGSHLLAGRTNPEPMHPRWVAGRRGADLVRLLEDALASDRVEEALAGLLPGHDGYMRLRDALAVYREFESTGGWSAIPSGAKLQLGDRGERVALLRKRLAAEGFDAGTGGADPSYFDDRLAYALQVFQERNGLEADGIVGRQTLQALNIPAARRIRQIRVNLERWRWLPRNLGDRYLVVNAAGFKLDVIESEKPVLSMRVVVGRTYRKTPVFSDRITYLVFNPHWGVPDKIARRDLLPKQKKDPHFLSTQKIRVFEGWGAGSKEIDPDSIDWSALTATRLPYRFNQDPGPLNALGRVKFMFPNKYDVYLHDTPSKELFARARRDFSSGCIRVEKAVELTEYLLRDHPEWPAERIRSSLTGGNYTTQTVKLVEPVNIHILYWTAWAGNEGSIYFSPDVYDRDTAVDSALKQPAP